jgi:small subunit ribosomal protein S27Ae
MAKKETKNKKQSERWNKYKVEGDKVTKARSCPKCGEGIFLAEHSDRFYCGTCHYVEMKSKSEDKAKSEAPKKAEDKN